ncbi:MAG: putative repeat protein (TIGR01451 family) [Halioglobus sp.]|jgi:uncharacterized repeat protein (TIGR01451 family)
MSDQIMKTLIKNLTCLLILLTNIIVAQVPINDSPCISTSTPPYDLTGGGSHNGTTCGALGPEDPGSIGGFADYENQLCSAQTEDASVWYMYIPSENEEGLNIILEDAGANGPMSLEYYSGPADGGCDGNLTELGASCNSNTADIKIGTCFSDGEVLYVKITTDNDENECGEFVLSIIPASCDNSNTPTFANEPCEANIFEPIEPITSDSFTFNYVCITGCLDFACPSQDAFGGCNDFEQNPTVWFKIKTDSLASQMFTTVEAFGNWDPVWSIYSGNYCDSLSIINFGGTPPCSNGSPSPELHQTSVFNDVSTYWVAITLAPASALVDGSFELCVTTYIQQLYCLGEDDEEEIICSDESLIIEVTEREVENEPLEGPFFPGEEVTISVIFFYDASESGADWLMGFVPVFGNGWDLSDFDYTMNAPIANDSIAKWFVEGSETAPIIKEPNPILCTFVNEDGELTICNQLCKPCADCPESGMAVGDSLPSGYFWVTEGQNPGCDNDGSIGEGWGVGSIFAQVQWDFTLKVKEFEDPDSCVFFTNLSISFQTFSHSTVGCWDDPIGECILDRAMYSPDWKMACVLPTSVFANDQEICHDGEVNIEVSTVDGSTTQIQVEVVDNPNVSGENSYTFSGGFGFIDDDLLNLTNTVQTVIYEAYAVDPTIPAPGPINQIEVTVYPEFQVTFPPVYICAGDCTDLNSDVIGGAGEPFIYNWSNGSTEPSINVCPVVPTTYTVTITDAIGCSDVGEVEVDVKQPVELLLPQSISVCKDDTFDPFNPAYFVCLDFISGSSPFNVNWTPDIGLVGEQNGFAGECFAINEVLSSAVIGSPLGSYTLTAEVTDFFGCIGFAEMEVNVTGELTMIAEASDLECGDNEASITVTGIETNGNPITTFLLYGGCPDDGLGHFLDELFSTSGTVSYPFLNLLAYTCYTIIGQTETGCQTTVDIEIPIPEAMPIEFSGTTDICLGSEAVINITNANDYISFDWSPDIGNSGFINFTPDSTDTYTVTAITATGCTTSESITITVYPLESDFCSGPCNNQQYDFQFVGTAYSDNNENGAYDAGDVPLNNVLVTDLANNFSTFTNILGQYVMPTEPGAVANLEANISVGDWEKTSISQNNIVVTDSCISDINFGFIPEDNIPNAQITVTNTITRCDFETKFYVTVENLNQESFSGEVSFTFDEEATFFSSDIPGLQVSGNQMTFNTGVVMPFKQNIYIFKLKMPNGSSSLPLLDFDAKLTEGEVLLDEYIYSEQLRCSYDPNDKRTNPDREGDENLTLIGETIDYTIRFQNNGNDTAFYVKIVDELDPFVDKTSIRFNSSSHPLYACIMGNTLIVEFNDIRLVDSSTNYPASQGFVNFSLDIDKAIPEGSVINNTADIIFDTNDPIITNTVIDTMVFDFCTDPMTDLSNTICEGESYLGYTETGIYQDTIVTEEGCDSILNIDLTVIPVVETNLEYTICEGEIIEYEGTYYDFGQSGQYTIENGGSSGCLEERLFFNITVIPTVILDTEVITICEDEDYEGLDSTGVYTFEIIDPNTNCPVIRTINLTVLPLTDDACITATNLITKENIQIYPNPTSNLLNIKSDYQITSFDLYTTSGKSLHRGQDIKVNNVEIDLSRYATGLYLLQIETINGRWIEKVVRR